MVTPLTPAHKQHLTDVLSTPGSSAKEGDFNLSVQPVNPADSILLSSILTKMPDVLAKLKMAPIVSDSTWNINWNWTHGVAAILAEGFISESQLCGGRMSVTLSHLSDMLLKWKSANLSHIQDANKYAVLAQAFDQCAKLAAELEKPHTDPLTDLKKTSAEAAKTIASLAEGEICFLPGGWAKKTGAPGMQMLYRFQRTRSSSTKAYYNISFYNTSWSARKFHQRTELIKNKTKICPVIHFYDVPEEKIFCRFGNEVQSLFVEALFDPLVLPQLWDSDSRNFKKYDEEDFVYKVIPGLIRDHFTLHPTKPEDFITPGFADNIPWSVALATVRDFLGHLPEYKKFVFDVKRDVCLALYQESKMTLGQANAAMAQIRNILRCGANGFARIVKKNVHLTHQDIQQCHDISGGILRILNAHESILMSQRRIEPNPRNLSNSLDRLFINSSTVEEKRHEHLHSIQKGSPEITNKKNTPNAILKLWETPAKPQDFEGSLKAILLHIPKLPQELVSIQIEQVINSLPIPSKKDPLWSQLTKEQTQACNRCFAQLTDLYFKSVRVHGYSQHRGNTFYGLLVMLEYLALRYESLTIPSDSSLPLLKDYFIHSSEEYVYASPFSIFFHLEDWERRDQLIAYTRERQETAGKYRDRGALFNFAALTEYTLSMETKQHPSDHQYYTTLKRSDPTCQKKMGLEGVAELISDLGNTEETTLGKPSYEHIGNLKRACYLFHIWTHLRFEPTDQIPSFHCTHSGDKTYQFSYCVTERSVYQHETAVGHQIYALQKEEAFIGEDLISLLISDNYKAGVLSLPARQEGTAEAKALLLDLKIKHSVLYKELIRISSEPEIEPFSILYTFSQQFESIAHLEIQAVFEMMFFRHIKTEQGERRLVVKEELALDSPLLMQILSFINQGLSYSSRLSCQEKGGSVSTKAFFVRFAQHVARYCRQIHSLEVCQLHPNYQGLIETNKQLDEWLFLLDLTIEDQMILHAHQIYAYIDMPMHALTEADIEKICIHWVLFRNRSKTMQGIHPYMFEDVLRYVQLVLNHHDKLISKNCNSICNQILGGMQISTKGNWERIPNSACFFLEYSADSTVASQIDFSLGVLYLNQEPITISNLVIGDESSKKLYTQMFGDRKFVCTRGGEWTYFLDAISERQYRFKGDFNNLECVIGERWCRYIPQLMLNGRDGKNVLPQGLLEIFAFWSPLYTANEQLTRTGELYITDWKTGSVCFYVNSKGKILAREGQKEISPGDVMQSSMSMDDYFAPMAGTGQTLVACHEGHINAIILLRYVSLTNKVLLFNNKNGLFICPEFPGYHLVPETQRCYLGYTDNYLEILNSTTNSRKLLFAIRLMDYSEGLSPYGHYDEGQIDLKKIFYVDVDVDENHQLYATTTEGKLLLTYLMTSQGTCKEAAIHLSQVSTDNLSQISRTLINWIIRPRIFKEYGNSTAAATVRLMALDLLLRQVDVDIGKGDVKFQNDSELSFNYNKYLAGVNKVHCKLSLPKQMEDRIFHRVFPSAINELIRPKIIPKNTTESFSYNIREEDFNPLYRNYSSFQDVHKRSYISQRMPLKDTERFFIDAYRIIKTGTEAERGMLRFFLYVQQVCCYPNEKHFISILLYALTQEPESLPVLAEGANKETQASRFQMFQKLKNMSRDQIVLPRVEWKYVGEGIPIENSQLPLYVSKRLSECSFAPKTSLALEPPALSFQRINKDLDHQRAIFATYVSKDVPLSNSEEEPPYIPKYEEVIESLIADAPLYAKAIECELKAGIAELKKGARLNRIGTYQFHQSPEQILAFVTTQYKKYTTEQEGLKVEILTLANKSSNDPTQKLFESILRNTNVQSELTMEDLIYLFLKKDRNLFQKMNPYLTSNEIDELFQMTGLYLQQGIFVQQLQRIEKHCRSLISCNNEADKKWIHHLLACELYSKPSYPIEKYWMLLVYEFNAAKIIFPEQADRLLPLVDRALKGIVIDQVIQHMMGKGKTSLLGVVLLEALASSHCLALMITPNSQLSSAKENVKKILMRCFRRTLEEVEIKRKQMTVSNLKKNLGVLRRARGEIDGEHSVLITSPEIPQGMELELVCQSAKILGLTGLSLKECEKKIDLLSKTLTIFYEYGCPFIDEGDLVLSALYGVTFPLDKKCQILQGRIELVRQIFEILNDATPAQGYTNFSERVGLSNNRQINLSAEKYKTTVWPELAERLIPRIEIFKIFENEKESLIRYISGTIEPLLQMHVDKEKLSPTEIDRSVFTKEAHNDIIFLQHLSQLAQSQKPEEREAANLVAKARHILGDILLLTLTKEGGRHYGRAFNGLDPTQIVPYSAANTPTDREHGNPDERLCYDFATASQSGIIPAQVKRYADTLHAATEFYILHNKEMYDDTCEAQEFLKMTNIKLSERHLPEKIAAATEYINKDVSKRLYIQAINSAVSVTYYEACFQSNAQNLVAQFKACIVVTGTPYNIATYPRSLSENLFPDEGVEGSIVSMLMQCNQERSCFHIVETKEPLKILYQVSQNHPKREALRGLMDPGGLTGEYTSLQIVESILKFLNEGKDSQNDYLKAHFFPSIDGIVFCQRIDDQDFFTLMRPHQDPIVLKKLDPETLLLYGCNLQNTFYLLSERQTTGIDIQQDPNSINVVAIDKGILVRTLCQALLRMRQFFQNQRAEIVALRESGFTSIQDMYLQAIKNQAIRKCEDLYKATKHKIDHVARNLAIKRLRDPKIPAMEKGKIYQIFHEFLTTYMRDEPYDQYGKLQIPFDTRKELQFYATCKENKLIDLQKQGHITIEELAEAQKELAKIKIDIESTPFLPSQVYSTPSATFTEQELQVDLSKERQNEKETDMMRDMNLQQELQLHQETPALVERKMDPWADESIEAFLIKGNDVSGISKILPLHTMVAACQQQLANKGSKTESCRFMDYSPVFQSDNLFVSTNFANPFTTLLPLFHLRQRPATQFLMVTRPQNNGEMTRSYYLLSSREIAIFQRWMHDHSQWYLSHPGYDVALMHADGNWIGSVGTLNHEDRKTISQAARLLINIFGANLANLVDKDNDAKQFLQGDHGALKTQYLCVRAAGDPEKKNFLNNCGLLSVESSEPQIVCVTRKSRQKLIARLRKYTSKEVAVMQTEDVPYLPINLLKYLNPKLHVPHVAGHQVPSLPDEWLKLLKTQEQIQNIPLKKLNEALRELLNSGVECLSFLTKEQIQAIKDPYIIQKFTEREVAHIFPEYIQYLLDEQLKWLTLASQIRLVPPIKVPFLSNHQLCYLETEEQIRAVGDSDPERIHFLVSEQQLMHITLKQLVHVSPLQVHKLPEWLLREIKKQEQLDSVPPARVKELKDTQVQRLQKAEQIAQVPKDRMYLLIEQQIKYVLLIRLDELNEGQFAWLSPHQIGSISNDAYFFKLKPFQYKHLVHQKYVQRVSVEHLVPKQYKWLSETQIQQLSKEQVASLDVQELEPSVFFANLKKEEQIQAIPEIAMTMAGGNALRYIDVTLWRFITINQVRAVNDPMMIQAITDEHLIKQFLPSQVEHVHPKQVLNLDVTQLPSLKTEEQMHAVDPKKAENCTPDQLLMFSKEQITELDTTQKHRLQEVIEQKVQEEKDKTSDMNGVKNPIGSSPGDTNVQKTPPSASKTSTSIVRAPKATPARHRQLISTLGDQDLSKLTDPDMLQVIPFQRVWHLKPSQVRHLSQSQKFVYYSTSGVSALVGAFFSCLAFGTGVYFGRGKSKWCDDVWKRSTEPVKRFQEILSNQS